MPARKTLGDKEELKRFKEEIIHQFHIVTENVMNQVKQVAEGMANLDEKFSRKFNELKIEIENKTQPIAQAVVDLRGRVIKLDEKVAVLDEKVGVLDGKVAVLDEKVTVLDGKVTHLEGKTSALGESVTGLNSKIDLLQREFKSDIQETRQEILAAVKFSYAELDKRITTLEKEFLDLKYRLEKLESRALS
ncbi:MAG: hypothetical protein N3G78_09580 [Desulfobacterota bacterium]|nr:hypothetical protein [Thermodesulfobacteriota bacterium]